MMEWFKMRMIWGKSVRHLSDAEAGRFIKAVYDFMDGMSENYGSGREEILIVQALETLRSERDAFENSKLEEDERKALIKEKRKKAAEARWKKCKSDANACICNANDANAQSASCKTDLHDFASQNKNKNIDKEKDICIDEEEEEVVNARARLIDPDWQMVANAYQKQIGLLPMGTALDTLISYVDDLHGETVVKAIEITNEKTPENPHQFLIAILKNFEKNGIDSLAKVEAYLLERERRKRNESSRNSGAVRGYAQGGQTSGSSGYGYGSDNYGRTTRDRADGNASHEGDIEKAFREYDASTIL